MTDEKTAEEKTDDALIAEMFTLVEKFIVMLNILTARGIEVGFNSAQNEAGIHEMQSFLARKILRKVP